MTRTTGLDLVSPVHVQAGLDNLAKECLRIQSGERVVVFSMSTDPLGEMIVRAATACSTAVTREKIETYLRFFPDTQGKPADTSAEADTQLGRALAGAQASIMLAPESVPAAMSRAVIRAAKRAGTRHLHLPRVDARVLASSARAEPSLIASINDRLAALMRAPARLKVTGESGSILELGLGMEQKLVCSAGRPDPGHWDNVPSGFVFTHPAQADGVFVADRAAWGDVFRADRAAIRRAPIQLTIAGGRVTAVSSTDPTLAAGVETHLASHANAARVGMVTISTNYLARVDIGNDLHDALTPGASLCLGYTNQSETGAPFDAPVQLRLFARKQTIDINGERAMTTGRFENRFVEGIDPFR
ncbi:MAG: hypothetical protein HOW73_31705 [Polyangiaceae bacterium]|nr:hypothetical protein [Polyangiaceae bacterium]